MSASATVRALSRVSPEMLLHRARRYIRDRLARKLPRLYSAQLAKWTREFPELDEISNIDETLAHHVSRFYRHSPAFLQEAANGRFTLLGATVDFGGIESIDWIHRVEPKANHHLWRMKLAQLEWLNDWLASGVEADHVQAKITLDSIERAMDFSREPFSTIWAPYGASHRLLALTSGLRLGASRELGTVQSKARDAASRFARRDAAFIWHNIELDLRNNHTERNLAALTLYLMGCKSVSPRITAQLERTVLRIVAATVLEDGVQIERSAMYQGLTVMSLNIFASAPFFSARTRSRMTSMLASAQAALAAMTHPDGEIALLNDSWTGETPRTEVLVPSGHLQTLTRLEASGYSAMRAASGNALFFDAGEIGPRWNPGHGHADFLSLELDVCFKRFLVDPGTSTYVFGEERERERSWRSHNGPSDAARDPVEFIGSFRVGRMARAHGIDTSAFALPELSVGGTLRFDGLSVARIVTSSDASVTDVLITDYWSDNATAPASRFTIPSTWHLDEAGASGARFSAAEVLAQLRLVSPGGHSLASGRWARRLNDREAALLLELRPTPEPSHSGYWLTYIITSRACPRGLSDEWISRTAALQRQAIIASVGRRPDRTGAHSRRRR